jgi:hypothetical protein
MRDERPQRNEAPSHREQGRAFRPKGKHADFKRGGQKKPHRKGSDRRPDKGPGNKGQRKQRG